MKINLKFEHFRKDQEQSANSTKYYIINDFHSFEMKELQTMNQNTLNLINLKYFVVCFVSLTWHPD